MLFLFGTHPAVALTTLVAALFGLEGNQAAAAATGNSPPQRRDHRPRDTAGRYNPPQYVSHHARADAIKAAFQLSWDGYYKHAFPHDSLRPVSNTFFDDRNGWGASAVDALSTALVMQNFKVVDQILDYIPTINFDYTNQSVSLFETTIRYLGGLISAYDLMTGNVTGKTRDRKEVNAILDQAVHLADNLKVAFDTPSGVPDNELYFDPPRKAGSQTNSIATIGTLVLEWTRLSDITGNPLYGQLAQRAESYLLTPTPKIVGEPFPGLLGNEVRISNGQFVNSHGGWGGGDDSFYEYLIKMYLYDPTRFAHYKHRWILAADSSMRHLISHPSSRPDLTYLAMWQDANTLRFVSEHLACFAGGNFILGGLTLDMPEYTNFGLELVNSCHNTYASTATHIGPEVFSWQDDRIPFNSSSYPGQNPIPSDQAEFYSRAGFWVDSGYYILRPEVVESYYYAYRATGDTKYQEWAWDAFLAIREACKVGSGYSGVMNVNKRNGDGYTDAQETFWFAEVLKYLYLMFSDDAVWQVQADHTNQFVYNTEAHPVRIARGYERGR
ncbi:glycoside hydrolase family 47 protein [Cercophora newfieldiana]|uniref:alpha-1,2-Mannosidase n=1 Tax=Cercophora newfieldiana TaxID=92897 RepID=A0AA40CKT4_9PEZI|nr:glycoside hydrolase family 47 protein [Cercophora newfieldiana]